jgi:hypothetical protein
MELYLVVLPLYIIILIYHIWRAEIVFFFLYHIYSTCQTNDQFHCQPKINQLILIILSLDCPPQIVDRMLEFHPIQQDYTTLNLIWRT